MAILLIENVAFLIYSMWVFFFVFNVTCPQRIGRFSHGVTAQVLFFVKTPKKENSGILVKSHEIWASSSSDHLVSWNYFNTSSLSVNSYSEIEICACRSHYRTVAPMPRMGEGFLLHLQCLSTSPSQVLQDLFHVQHLCTLKVQYSKLSITRAGEIAWR